MAGNADYLPPGIPFNRAQWPQDLQLKEHYDMRACGLISQLYDHKVTRGFVMAQLERTPETYREFFRQRLNVWREENDAKS